MTGNSQHPRQRGRSPIAIGLMGLALSGCGRPKIADDPLMGAGAIVYVDLKTNEPVVQLASREVPAEHPRTGEKTLMPGLYCPTCRRWHPAPPFETLQRIPGAAVCPTDGTPMKIDGPWPQGDD